MITIESSLCIWIIISKMLFEIATFTSIAFILGISTVLNHLFKSVGISASTIINILLVIGLNYTPKQGIIMTYIFLIGGGLAATIANCQNRTPKGKRVIDNNLVLLTLPMLISGTIFGTILSHLLSEETITIVFILFMLYVMRTTYKQIQQNWQQPNLIEINHLKDQLVELKQDFSAKTRLEEILEEQEKLLPCQKIKLVLHIFVYTAVLLLFKGGIGFDSIIGLDSCHIGSWICVLLHFVLSYLYSKSIAMKKFQIDVEKESLGYIFQDSRQKMSYNKMREAMFNGFLGGTLGGCFALSAGLVLIPQWLRAGIDRKTVVSSTAPLIFFGSSISLLLSLLQGSYSSLLVILLFFSISFIGSFYVKKLFVYFQEKYQSNRMQLAILLVLMLVSFCVYISKQYKEYKQNPSQFQDFYIFC